MTVERMMQEIWEATGEESDLDPTDTLGNYSVTTTGGARLLQLINLGQTAVAHWKDKVTGHHARFKELFGELYFEHGTGSGQVLAINTASTQVSIKNVATLVSAGTAATTYNDRYNGWVIKIGSEQRMVMDTDINGNYVRVTVNDAFSSAEAGDDWELYKRFNLLLPSSHRWVDDHITLPTSTDLFVADGNLIEPLKIYDMYMGRELSVGVKGSGFISSFTELGDPGQWYYFGKKLYFDRAPEESRWFWMEYYRNPIEMTALSDEPEIPTQFHMGIVLWCIEAVYRRDGEAGDKYSAKRDFEDFMKSTVTADDMLPARNSFGGKLKMR